MKFKRIILFCILLCVILSLNAVNASDELNTSISIEDNLDVSIGDNILGDDDLDDDEENDSYSDVIIDIPDLVEIGAEDVIEVQLPEDALGRVVIYVDNEKFYENNTINGEEDNIFTKSLDDLNCGMHLVNVTFISSNAKYGTVTNQTWVNVTYNITITLDDNPYIFGKETNKVHVSAPSDILNEIIVTIDNERYKLTAESNSRGYIDISGFDGGSYLIVASFEGNQNYTKYSTNETIRIVSAIDAPLDDLEYGNKAYVTLKVPGDAQGVLSLSINGVLYKNTTFSNGVAQIEFPTSKVGEFYYNVTCVSEEFDIENITDRYIRIIPKINIPTQMTVGENKYLTFDINGDAGGYFVIEADGDVYATSNAGHAVSLSNLEDGDIDIGIIYYGTDGFVYPYDPYTVIVNSLPVKFIGVKNINMIYGDGTKYSLTIYGTNGKPLEEDEYVEFRIGKYEFEGYTNSKGVVNFKIPNSVVPGKYTVTVIYDDDYSVKSNLVVNKVLTLKKTNVKKSAKKIVLMASLKKINKKFLKGKTIIFKFNGKKFTAKTDKKGVAKVTIKENILKKLKVGKKVTYQAIYLKSMVKKSVKVKK